MKKILFVAAIATLLTASCQKTEVINPVGGDAMSFTTGMNKLTKASDADYTGLQNLQEQNFRVWAYYVAANDNTGAAAGSLYDGMGNAPVTYNKENEKWGTDKQYYWPGTGKQLKFFAVSANSETYGAANDVNAGKVKISEDRATLTIENFEVKSEANDDLMVADFVQKDQGSGPNDKVVNLKFRHVLSKVEFLFNTDPDLGVNVWVQEVSVNNLNTKSTLTVTEQDGVTVPVWGERTVPIRFYDDYVNADDETPLPTTIVPKEDATYEIKDATNAMYLTGEAKPFTTWLVIPQDIKEGTTDLKVDVVYVMGDRQFLASFDLGTTTLKKWDTNQYIKYTITLTPNLISFNPTVEPWTPTGDDTILDQDGNETDEKYTEDTPHEEERGN